MGSKTYLALVNRDDSAASPDIDGAFEAAFSAAIEDIIGKRPDASALILPPDATRLHSGAGRFTDIASRVLGKRLAGIMPALGTHKPMDGDEIARMFPGSPADKFLVHDWRNDVTELGRLEGEFVERVSGGAVSYDWPAQVNKRLIRGDLGLVVSIGQVVPHEVAGMANHAKNVFVGSGGKEGIDKSHFAGAAYGMERIMGRTDNPVRALFDEALERWNSSLPPVLYVLSVVGPGPDRGLRVRGLFVGTGRDCFERAAELSREFNLDMLDRPVRKAVVYLDPDEYRSTWLGNKAVYRTRMAMADGGELLILAPGLRGFGEDRGIDALIRRYGYRDRATVLSLVKREPDLAASLSAAAHLIHGCPEGRFTVRYCPGPGLSRAEIEKAGFSSGSLEEALKAYPVDDLATGWNEIRGEEIFFVPNPALGLWTLRSRFE
jgi:nickel-dependent lactate racemase